MRTASQNLFIAVTNYSAGGLFRLFKIIMIKPTIARTNESNKSNAPGMIPNIASSQLVRPSVKVGSRTDTRKTPPPIRIPMTPRINATNGNFATCSPFRVDYRLLKPNYCL